MSTTKVCCQGCGAALEVDETVRFVTCNVCQSRLEVIHEATVTHTRLLEDSAHGTGLVSAMRVLQLQNELGQLDRDWDRTRGSLMMRGKYGRSYEPSTAGSVIGGIVMLAFGVFWIGLAAQIGGGFALVGIAIIGLALFGTISGLSKADSFKIERASYENARKELEERIRKVSTSQDEKA